MDRIIREHKLQPHPEGGYYREVYRSGNQVCLSDGRVRDAITAIQFLLGRSDVSRWHRVASDELWNFCEGEPLELHEIHLDLSNYTVHKLGSDTGTYFAVIRAGHWQAARSTGEYSLVSCMVGPGFEFEDFELLSDVPDVRQKISEKFPESKKLI
jgi:predicted cupin superfamily sugar epimerase